METKPDTSCLHGHTVILPGGHDKEGRPYILISIPAESPSLDIIPPLQYLLSIFSIQSSSRGFTVLIDVRKGQWKVARNCIKQVSNIINDKEQLAQIIVLRSDAFWDKQRIENCTSTNTMKSAQIFFIPRSRLNKFVDQSQLPQELGGNFIYNHEKWIEHRQKVEKFYNSINVTLKDLDNLYQYLIELSKTTQTDETFKESFEITETTKILVNNSIEIGKNILESIESDNRKRKLESEFESMTTPLDILDTIEKIDEIILILKKKKKQIIEVFENIEKSLSDTKDINILQEGVVKVINWILGPAENLLNSCQKVGYDVSSAEELRREHEAIELQCWETYGAYAELIHKIKNINTNNLQARYKNLISQKDFMDFVCRSFALRLERRRNILITSLRFFRLVSEYFNKTSEVFDSLVMGNKINFVTAKEQLILLHDSQMKLDTTKKELVKEGEKFSDMLSMPVKNALSRDIIVDYSEDIANIRDILIATTARKNIFDDSVELQKLTLEQATHIEIYEKDVSQAIQWLDDLFQVLLKDHGHVGCTVYEIQIQKNELLVFQETAKDTYSYGCQLLNASLALRQSCKLLFENHTKLNEAIKNSWLRLLGVSQEQMTRLTVSIIFHRSVEEYCNQLRDLREAVATIPFIDLVRKKARVCYYFGMREKLMIEVGRMVRLGRLLRSRLKEPLYFDEIKNFSDLLLEQEGNNETAIESISERLNEVTDLSEDLDQALHSAHQDCSILLSASLFSNSLDTEMSDKQTESELKFNDNIKSEEEILTASDSTLQHSQSSSYNTASECEHQFGPWWEYNKNDKVPDSVSKAKLILAFGQPNLPIPNTILKSSPEVPPGKIAHEVIETTHLKVQHQHTMDVSSFVLTSETVEDNNNTVVEVPLTPEKLLNKINEVGVVNKCDDDNDDDNDENNDDDNDNYALNKYLTKQAIKNLI